MASVGPVRMVDHTTCEPRYKAVLAKGVPEEKYVRDKRRLASARPLSPANVRFRKIKH